MLSKVPICAAPSWAKGCICCCCIWTGTEPPDIQRRDMKRSKILHSSKCGFLNEFRFLFYESGESEPRTKQSLGYRWIQLGHWSLAACCSCCAWIVVPSPESSLESAFPSHSINHATENLDVPGTWKPPFWWSSFSSPVAEKRLWKLLEIGWLLRKLLLEVIALLVLSLPWLYGSSHGEPLISQTYQGPNHPSLQHSLMAKLLWLWERPLTALPGKLRYAIYDTIRNILPMQSTSRLWMVNANIKAFQGATKSEGKTWKSHPAPHHTQRSSAHTQNRHRATTHAMAREKSFLRILTHTIAKAFWETTIKNQQQTANTKPRNNLQTCHKIISEQI